MLKLSEELIKIDKTKMRSLVNDTARSAAAIKLVYVSDQQPGITRIRKGNEFVYMANSRQIRSGDVLSRIKSLVIPPAWEQVWICSQSNGHIQATGIDSKGRKQYRYHPLWTAIRKETKFFHLYDFGKALPVIRKRLKQDMALQGFPMEKILAVIVSIMENTGVRIGSNFYEKMYGSYGITTLKDRHVNVNGNEIKFSFMGKKGVIQDLTLRSKKLARIVQQCKDIPGKDLFQYYDENGIRHNIDSGMVNQYIGDISGSNFTAKDFRTWFGTICALEVFLKSEECADSNGTNKKVIEALDVVAKRLGNTRMVCRKYYVHPVIIDHFSRHDLAHYVQRSSKIEGEALSQEEKILMAILGDMDKIVINK